MAANRTEKLSGEMSRKFGAKTKKYFPFALTIRRVARVFMPLWTENSTDGFIGGARFTAQMS
ncbi:hypothetical protein V7x_18170 [Crateriforma conspicua]|uniref:Uncharacterized protein n=1 Tax=Crateriforma conspicua TaxID=2527996 RepID=A0A5C6FXB0_9PLAN|nr:hypothetical protein V7x_18170 [Crateriforma conspicua]